MLSLAFRLCLNCSEWWSRSKFRLLNIITFSSFLNFLMSLVFLCVFGFRRVGKVEGLGEGASIIECNTEGVSYIASIPKNFKLGTINTNSSDSSIYVRINVLPICVDKVVRPAFESEFRRINSDHSILDISIMLFSILMWRCNLRLWRRN